MTIEITKQDYEELVELVNDPCFGSDTSWECHVAQIIAKYLKK